MRRVDSIPLSAVGLTALAVFAQIGAAFGAESHGPDARGRNFLQRYRSAAAALRAFYDSVEIEAIVTKIVREGVDKPETIHVRYRSRPPLKRIDVIEIVKGSEQERSGVIGRDVSFEAARGPNGQYHVSGLSSNPQRAVETMRRVCPVFSAAYGFLNGTVEEIVSDDKLRITDIREFREGGETVVSVHLVNPGKGPKHWEFAFFPQKHWALKSYWVGVEQRGTPGRKRMCAEVEYEGEIEGLPILKHAEFWDEGYRTAGEVVRAGITRVEVTAFRQVTAPAKDFTLAAFGLPNINSGATQKSYVPYAVFVAGIVVILIGVLIKRYATSR